MTFFHYSLVDIEKSLVDTDWIRYKLRIERSYTHFQILGLKTFNLYADK